MATKTIEQIDASIDRWDRRLRRAVCALAKLKTQRKRLAQRLTKPPVARPEPLAVTIMQEMIAPAPAPDLAVAHPLDTSIPSFLRRTPDPVAEQIKAEQAETKKKKAAGRIATMKAKKAGDLKKMPLTGKAALAAIRSAG